MSIERSVSVAYGVRIPDDTDPDLLIDPPGEGPVEHMIALAYKGDRHFLAIAETRRVIDESENLFMLGPYAATDTKYLDWDAGLVHAAETHRVPLVSAPAWIVVYEES